MIVASLPLLDELLDAHAGALASDAGAYRNHAYRVANFCFAFSAVDRSQLDKIAVAAACHDLGIWTDRTFDYLEPSALLATRRLLESPHAAWADEVREMILQHHKLTRYRANADWLVEPFRCADLIDLSRGLVRFGLPRTLVREILAQWPNAGFHKRLLSLAGERARSHPLSPLPMLRL